MSDAITKLEAMLRRVFREELERRDEAQLERREALREKPGRLTAAEAENLRAYLRENNIGPLRWKRGQTERPRRRTVETWWTDEHGRPGHDLDALLEGDGDEGAESGEPEGEEAI